MIQFLFIILMSSFARVNAELAQHVLSTTDLESLPTFVTTSLEPIGTSIIYVTTTVTTTSTTTEAFDLAYYT